MNELTNITGQVAVVTGGTAGMGEAAAVRFGAEGAKVAVVGRTPEKGDAVVKRITDAGGEAMFVKAECADEGEVKAGVKTIRLWPKWLKNDANLVRRVRKTGAKLHLNGTTGKPDDVFPLLLHKPDSLSSDDPARLVKTLKEL